MKGSTESFLLSPGKLPCSTGPSLLSHPDLFLHGLKAGVWGAYRVPGCVLTLQETETT